MGTCTAGGRYFLPPQRLSPFKGSAMKSLENTCHVEKVVYIDVLVTPVPTYNVHA